MAWNAGSIVSKLVLTKDKWDASIKKVQGDQRTISGVVAKNSASFKKLGTAITLVGGALVGLSLGAVKAFASFDKAMTESLAIMGNVSDSMRKKMADAAMEMSTKTTYSATELAKAYFYLASAGMDAAQSIGALPAVAKFAQAGAFDLAKATDLLTDAQTALGLSSKDVAENQKNLIRVSDVLVGANTLANASVEQFAESLTNKAAAALINVNKSMEEGVAVLAAYADKGVKGSLAGQRLTMMLNGLLDASQQNKKEWDKMGISLFDTSGEMRSIADIVASLEIKLGDMTTEQKQATLATLGFSLRTKDSILTLMGSSEKIRQWTKDLKNMGGITDTVSKKQLQTLSNQLKLVKNNLMAASISIGETLAPSLEKLTEKLKGTTKEVTVWIKEHPKLTAAISKSTLKVGAFMIVLGPFIRALPGLTVGVLLLKNSFHSMLGPIGLIITALGFITFEVIKANKHFKNLTATISEFSEKSGKKISWFEKTLWSLDETYRKFTTGVSNSEIVARKMRGEIAKLDKEHVAYGKKLWDTVKGTDGFSKASDILNKLLGKQKEITEDASEATSDLGETIASTAVETKTWIDYIKSIGLMTVKEKGDRVEELEGYVDELSKAYAAGKISLEDYTKALKAATDEIEDLSTAITNTAIPAANDMSGVVEQAAIDMESEFYDAGEGIKGSAEDTEKAIEKTWDELHLYWSNLCTDLGTSFGNFTGSILSTGSDMKDALAGLWSDIKSSWIGMAVDMVADWGTKFIKKILSSITSDLVPGIAAKCVEVKAASAACGGSAGGAAGGSFLDKLGAALPVLAVEAIIFAAFIGAVSLLDKLFPKHVKTMAELAAIEAKKAFDKAAKEYALPGEWGKGGIVAEPGETGGGGQPPAEPEGSYQFGGLVRKTGLAIVHQGEFVIPKISVPEMNIPEMRSPGISKKINITIPLQPVFQFNNQIDPNFTKRFFQKDLWPIFITSLRTGSRKTEVKEALGVA